MLMEEVQRLGYQAKKEDLSFWENKLCE